jgi:protoheme IX farnesyltransferase
MSANAWTLYAVLFLWQFPHFMAIAWMYREDYARAGYLVLPSGDQSGRFMSWQALLTSLALIPVSLIPTMIGHAGLVFPVLAGTRVVFLLQRQSGFSKIHPCCASIAFVLNRLSATGVLSAGA